MLIEVKVLLQRLLQALVGILLKLAAFAWLLLLVLWSIVLLIILVALVPSIAAPLSVVTTTLIIRGFLSVWLLLLLLLEVRIHAICLVCLSLGFLWLSLHWLLMRGGV